MTDAPLFDEETVRRYTGPIERFSDVIAGEAHTVDVAEGSRASAIHRALKPREGPSSGECSPFADQE